ncbi:hypothetical protein LH61_04760 [Leuconostoc mesenteroides P45]|uniref:hypothetical protein n=1 Tax=Leuconostoc mesenteroides TaxID=1245 RepID=UPI000500F684|nr:hypothetical protein [Leuconostoc mesenteroides]KGB50811.1 hypothetical protein LH61_04760 [Leuconostoc mesenteroides P45]
MMLNILKSEFLKTKHSGSLSDAIIIPIFTTVLSLVIGGPEIFTQFTIYWWETLFLFLLVGVLFLNDQKSEQRAGDFQNIEVTDKSFNIYMAKIVLNILFIIMASFFLVIANLCLKMIFPSIIKIDVQLLIITCLGIVISMLWNIPLIYIVGRKVNNYVVIVINIFLCFLIAPFIANSYFWELFPYTYHYHIAERLYGIEPSGEQLAKFAHTNINSYVLPLFLSLLLFLFFIILLKKETIHDQDYN